MSNYINTWGLYQWFPEHGEDLIFAGDLEKFKALLPNGKVFHCVFEDHEYLTLQYHHSTYLVKPDIYKKVTTPLFSFDDRVKVINHSDRLGIIKNIMWHFQKNSIMYFLEIDGKYSSKRYWQEDLILFK